MGILEDWWQDLGLPAAVHPYRPRGRLGSGNAGACAPGVGIAPTISDNLPRGLIASLGCWRSVVWRGQEQALQQVDGGDYRGGVFRHHCIGQVVFVKMQMQAVGVGGSLF